MNDSPDQSGPPADVTHLVRERTEARAGRDWARADALKAQIEAAGWRIVDHGGKTTVSPAGPATIAVDGELRFGSAADVPSLLDTPATTAWTVVVVAADEPARLSRLLGALRAHAPDGTHVVVVANDPSDSQAAALRPDSPDRAPIGDAAPELLRTAARLGHSAALNIGLRRATGELVLLADATAWPTGDAITPLAAALGDPAIAAAGGFGLYAQTPGRLRPSELGREPTSPPTAGASAGATAEATAGATALEGAWLAFRRADYRELGPLDERFAVPAWLDVWWTLRLRAGADPESAEPGGAEPAGAEAGPRRAVFLRLPLEREEVAWPPGRSRLNRRNMYQVLDRYGPRDDLA